MSNIENVKDLIIYQSQNNENISVEVLYDEEDFWLTQKSMSQLFNVEVNTINYHLKEIFKSEELKEDYFFLSFSICLEYLSSSQLLVSNHSNSRTLSFFIKTVIISRVLRLLFAIFSYFSYFS